MLELQTDRAHSNTVICSKDYKIERGFSATEETWIKSLDRSHSSSIHLDSVISGCLAVVYRHFTRVQAVCVDSIEDQRLSNKQDR